MSNVVPSPAACNFIVGQNGRRHDGRRAIDTFPTSRLEVVIG